MNTTSGLPRFYEYWQKEEYGSKELRFSSAEVSNRVTLLCQEEILSVWQWDTFESPRLSDSLWQD